jgi:hypothetical protein
VCTDALLQEQFFYEGFFFATVHSKGLALCVNVKVGPTQQNNEWQPVCNISGSRRD